MMFFGTLCALLLHLVLAVAQTLPDLPPCATQCLLLNIGTVSQCSLLDFDCICADQKLTLAIETCVMEECRILDQLKTKNASATMCNEPIRDISHITPTVTTVSCAIAVIAVAIRCSTSGALELDNIFAVVSFLSALPMAIAGLATYGDGFGKDIWTLTPEKITSVVRVLWLSELSYLLAVGFTKISYLFFCLRIFPRKGFRTTIYVLMGIVVAYFIAFSLVCIFNCTPVSYIWTHWDGEHEGHCINFNIFAWAHAAVNIALDITLVAVPIPELIKLSLSWRRKIFIIMMFSVGAFTTIVSMIRLHSLIQFSTSMNPTYDNVPAAYWSALEAYSGILCICMPAIRRFCVRLFPVCFGTQGSSNGREYPTPANATPPKIISSAAKKRESRSTVGFNTMLRGSGIVKTIDTSVTEGPWEEEDKIQLVSIGGALGRASDESTRRAESQRTGRTGMTGMTGDSDAQWPLPVPEATTTTTGQCGGEASESQHQQQQQQRSRTSVGIERD